MNNFEFLNYEPVENEKFLGVATVRAWGKIILRYKIIPGKDGRGFFAASSSIKVGDKFENSFVLDSSYENQSLIALIKDHVTNAIARTDPSLASIKQGGEYPRPAQAPKPSQGQANQFPQDDDCPF